MSSESEWRDVAEKLREYGNPSATFRVKYAETVQRLNSLQRMELPDEVLAHCRLNFRMWIVEALANFRFEPYLNGFHITEPQTGCQWTATRDKSNIWKFACICEGSPQGTPGGKE